MQTRIVILGAGFGGMELATTLSESVADAASITLIECAPGFVFGYSKLDVMFGHASPESVFLPYEEFVKPGVEFVKDTVVAIDPAARRVTTTGGSYDADLLVIALGADYDYAATPGFDSTDQEFYSMAGAIGMRDRIDAFREGRAVIGVCGAPFKCPPAPMECALLLHDHLARHGVRDRCEITLVLPHATLIPPSPDTSAALLEAFGERSIHFLPSAKVASVDRGRGLMAFEDGAECAYDLFLGVPKHRAPNVVIESGLTVDGFIPVNPVTLETASPGVYAIGDVATQSTPKAGVFAEGAARALASTLIARVRAAGEAGRHTGTGACYVEMGGGRVARVDVDFLSGPSPIGVFQPPSPEVRAEKDRYGSSRRMRWFGRPG
jgi:sulfide:quinone oxidoreductase